MLRYKKLKDLIRIVIICYKKAETCNLDSYAEYQHCTALKQKFKFRDDARTHFELEKNVGYNYLEQLRFQPGTNSKIMQ